VPFDAKPRPLRTPAPPAQPSAAALNLWAKARSGRSLLSFERAVIVCAERQAARAGETLNPAHIDAALASGDFVKEMYS
jgi:hypothetical protein